MTTFPNAPRLLKGGLVLLDPETAVVERVIVLQYNPHTLSRTLQAQRPAADGDDRAGVLRLKGPPIETYQLEAEIDAADQLEFPDQNPDTAELGLYPTLAALETILYPASSRLLEIDSLANAGTLEIAPPEAPLTLFIWSAQRIVPVQIDEFSVTEEAFDPNLNPLRAKVSLRLRVLSVTDLGFQHKGGSLYMAYQQQKERLAERSRAAGLGAFGIQNIP